MSGTQSKRGLTNQCTDVGLILLVVNLLDLNYIIRITEGHRIGSIASVILGVIPSKNLNSENIVMGAWAEDTFGNDSACDWISIFLDDPGLPAVKSVIETVIESNEYLDSDDACDCLAACEVIARLQGKWGLRNSYSEDLDKWVESNPTDVPSGLKTLADSAIERILGPDSELPELWDDGARNDEWHNAIDDLRDRIRG